MWAIYAVWAVRLMHRLLNKDLLYLTRLTPNSSAQCQAAARYDVSQLSHLEMYLGVALLLPTRMLLSLPILALLFVFAWVPKTICGGTLH